MPVFYAWLGELKNISVIWKQSLRQELVVDVLKRTAIEIQGLKKCCLIPIKIGERKTYRGK
jgi:hypothetical protein